MILTVADDELFLEHESPAGHPERPDRLRAARRGLLRATSGTEFEVRRLPARDATFDELASVHERSHVERILELDGRRGYLDADTFFSPRSLEATRRASGAALSLVDSVIAGPAKYGLGLVRPPGHHAGAARAMGFCLVNHAGVATRHAQRSGVGKVLVLDWDVHHGNGTEELFFSDPSVLYISLHQSPQYPGTGAADITGVGRGSGCTVNLPLSAGATDAVYRAAFERIVLPVAVGFAPELVVVSAGYDAHERDPLGGMSLTDAAYGYMTAELRKALGGETPLAFLLEGGYDLLALEGAIASTLQGLVTDRFEVDGGIDGRHDRELEEAARVQRRHWSL